MTTTDATPLTDHGYVHLALGFPQRYYGACGACAVGDGFPRPPLPQVPPTTSLRVTERELETLRELFADAWAYRLGEASGIEDPELNPHDRAALLRFEAFGVVHLGHGD